MKIKRIITLVLIIFVIISIAFVIIKENKPQKQENTPAGVVSEAPATESKVIQKHNDKNYVVVYYFHGNMRCRTCMAFEEYIQNALDDFFAEKMKEGKLVYKVINVEDSGNEHFIRDYNLVTKSVVVAEFANGKEVKWKKLDKIWNLVGNKQQFIGYIKSEINSMAM